MLYPYRVLNRDLSSGKISISYYHTLEESYKACVSNYLHHCCLLFYGLEDMLQNKGGLVRVTCYSQGENWIESLAGKIEPYVLPNHLGAKIECNCHCNKGIPDGSYS
jgi:hypothetical protein